MLALDAILARIGVGADGGIETLAIRAECRYMHRAEVATQKVCWPMLHNIPEYCETIL